MFKVLVKTLLQDCGDNGMGVSPLTIDKAELQDLFRDDFAAQAVMIRSRKAMRAAQVQMAA
jgi:hypothetical protein